MRWTRWTALAAPLATLGLALVALSCATPAQKAPAAMTQAEKVARGEYLTTIMACNDCHTPGTFYGAPDYSRKLSGSELGWVGPWGTSYARNLTPDPETGIGSWSEDDIVKTIRTGQRADGTPVMPPMPWPMYTQLSDDDAYAIAAYLKSLPAVSHKVPDKLPPGSAATPHDFVIPQPTAWDAPRSPAGGAPTDTAAAH
jgi:mono/diheme cytochrome c family protein